jgi:FkbM family methyltransferase
MTNENHMERLVDPTGHNMSVMAERLNHIINKIRIDEVLTVLDIGSMDGWETINLARVFHDARIHCFEPVPSNYTICEKHIKQYLDEVQRRNVTLHRLALNDRTGSMTFHAIDEYEASRRGKINRGMGSKYQLIDPDMWPWEHNKQHPITVAGFTLTDWAAENSIDRVDGIWMDVQGAELDVLKGISPELFSKIQFIITEAGLKPYYHGQSLKVQMDELLEKQGFVEWLPAQQIAHEYEANVIYLNRALCNF